jgi:probable F420-dependent oxidoreductase
MGYARAVQIGAVFPQTRFDGDPAAVRDFAQAAEELGYSHMLVYDHVLGAEHEKRDPELWGPYTDLDPFHEPFVLLGYIAGITTRIELGTGVLILPQRQTALVAKQAAEIDLLSGGRLRLGVGLGWNYVEYQSLNEDFSNRGARCTEQVDLLRRLWAEPLLDYRGDWHRIDRASILPRPSRQIPIWFGGFKEPALRRAARIGDGFIFSGRRERLIDAAERLRGHLVDAGRESDPFGFEAFVEYGRGPEYWQDDIDAYERAGFTHVAMRSINAGLPGPQDHIDALAEYAAAIGIRP